MITTCLRCPLKVVEGQTCEIFSRAKKAIRGSGVTSARIRCDKRKKLFRPGQYVTFQGVNRDPENPGLEQYYGWIWKFDPARNTWLICGEDTSSPFVRIRPDRIWALDGNIKRCCLRCGKPEGVADKFNDRKASEERRYSCGGHYEERGLWNGEWVEDGCEFSEATNAL